jgi:hypothetical protein
VKFKPLFFLLALVVVGYGQGRPSVRYNPTTGAITEPLILNMSGVTLTLPVDVTRLGSTIDLSGGEVTGALPWGSLSGKPTTLSGYGITDPVVLTTGSYANPAWVTSLAWSKLSSTPTSLSGYGIVDPIVLTTGSYANPGWVTSLAWSKLTGVPTTLSGYGITDPVVLTTGSYANPAWVTSLAWSKLTGVPSFEPALGNPSTNGYILSSLADGTRSWIAPGGGGGSGTVTSVGLALPSIFSVTNSPVTTTGTLTGSLATQSANLVLAGPVSGGAAAPTFRAIVEADIPSSLIDAILDPNVDNVALKWNDTLNRAESAGGVLGTAAFTASTAYEPALGNPGINGYVLSSTTAGVRSWIEPGSGGASDTAFNSSWDGVTTISPSKNAIYDWAHFLDSDDDGKVNLLDLGAGLVKSDAGGVVSVAVADTDYVAPGGNIAAGTATTPAANDNDTSIATTAHLQTELAAYASDTVTFTNKRITPRITTIVSSATPAINTDNADAVTITALAAAITSMTSSLTGTPSDFDKLMIRIKDDGTGRAITWGESFVSSAVTLPATTVAGKVTTVGLQYDSVKVKWICLAVDQEP